MELWALPRPTIAAVRGWCLAGACELAMACDMIVAADDARFGEPEIRYGSGPVSLLMPFILGQKKTNELLFTGDWVDAPEAERLGLVNRVAPVDELEAAVDALVAKIAPTPLPVLRLTKLALTRAYEAMGLRQAVNANLDLSAILNAAETPEQREFDGIVAEQGLKAALAWRDAPLRRPLMEIAGTPIPAPLAELLERFRFDLVPFDAAARAAAGRSADTESLHRISESIDVPGGRHRTTAAGTRHARARAAGGARERRDRARRARCRGARGRHGDAFRLPGQGARAGARWPRSELPRPQAGRSRAPRAPTSR